MKGVHEGLKSHKCDLCGKAFCDARYLKIHVTTVHEGKKNHKCDLCDKGFTQASSLNSHINR